MLNKIFNQIKSLINCFYIVNNDEPGINTENSSSLSNKQPHVIVNGNSNETKKYSNNLSNLQQNLSKDLKDEDNKSVNEFSTRSQYANDIQSEYSYFNQMKEIQKSLMNADENAGIFARTGTGAGAAGRL